MRKEFPIHPATMEVYSPNGTVDLELQRNFAWWEEPQGANYAWAAERDTGDELRQIHLDRILQDLHGFFEATTPDGLRIVVRPYDEYDPVRMDVSTIPWPRTVAQDWMIGEQDMRMQALVDDNGDVATLMLDSPSAAYLRYDGAWVLLTDLEAIGDYDIVTVEDSALDIYDPYDQTGKSVKITSMPVVPEDDFRVQVRYSGGADAEALEPILKETVVASLEVPSIAAARDIPEALAFAADHPEFRWYVERRSRALGIEMDFPWDD